MGFDVDASWPFDQPEHCAVITLRSIVFGGAPVLHVTHDADDRGWQFLSSGDADVADAAVVALSEIVERDPSLLQLADLQPGVARVALVDFGAVEAIPTGLGWMTSHAWATLCVM